MTTPLLKRGAKPTPITERNDRHSRWAQAKRPLPATRDEADALFKPAAGNAPAKGSRLFRANELKLLHPEGRAYTQGELHRMILDALYPEG